ncbi:MAG: XTP/dITP diphosphohydrolase [Hyphomicrobiales bacterium]|jgi:XTP/dITP diphosphohydrolase|nr:XTP/dITP diphosphohydrolase [Hyphomicrobiales bacterium]
MTGKIEVIYSTTNPHKQAEIRATCDSIPVVMPDGSSALIGDVFTFVFRDGRPVEPLERDLEQMVNHKVLSAYRTLLVPCIAEHAGLVFSEHVNQNYPGGLTQPMWDALGARKFVDETSSAGRQTIARAVIGYCDGLKVRCFVGETEGSLADRPRGNREFYWDTVFVPKGQTSTYAEICDDPSRGLTTKVALSQSTKALVKFLEFRLTDGAPHLFP